MYSSDVVLFIFLGTFVVLLLAGFITSLIFLYKQRYKAQAQALIALQETSQRELLQAQLDTQNQTLQQIAQDIHDNIGQLLTVVVMRLNNLEEDVKEPNAQYDVQQTRNVVRTIITDVRALSKTLNHETVAQFGLIPSLTVELERIKRAGRVQTELTTTGDPYLLGKQTEVVLLRMAQESLNNALKHAQAKKLTVIADYKTDTFTLIISDDGQGFRLDEARSRSLDQSGAGLNNLHHRATLLGGHCHIVSQPGQGTRIDIQVPRPLSA